MRFFLPFQNNISEKKTASHPFIHPDDLSNIRPDLSSLTFYKTFGT
jgi:hypothetical protein